MVQATEVLEASIRQSVTDACQHLRLKHRRRGTDGCELEELGAQLFMIDRFSALRLTSKQSSPQIDEKVAACNEQSFEELVVKESAVRLDIIDLNRNDHFPLSESLPKQFTIM